MMKIIPYKILSSSRVGKKRREHGENVLRYRTFVLPRFLQCSVPFPHRAIEHIISSLERAAHLSDLQKAKGLS